MCGLWWAWRRLPRPADADQAAKLTAGRDLGSDEPPNKGYLDASVKSELRRSGR